MKQWQKCGLLTAIFIFPILTLQVTDWHTFQLTNVYEVSEFLCYFVSTSLFMSSGVAYQQQI